MEMLSLWGDEGKAPLAKRKRIRVHQNHKRGRCLDCGIQTSSPSKPRCRTCAGKARQGQPVGKFSERTCAKCGATYIPTMGWQKQCDGCLAVERQCANCGAAKRSQGPLCKTCDAKQRIGKPATWNSKPLPTDEEIIAAGEALGLVPEKYYAFGYVLGVVFGDGAISEETNTIPYTCKDGTVTTHDSTVFRVRLQTISEVFARRFAAQWTILTGKPPTIQSTMRTRWSKSSLVKNHRPTLLYMVQPRHTILGRFFQLLKYREEDGSKRVLEYPEEVQQAFVHGMIDSEGHVAKNLTMISNKVRPLLETIQQVLLHFKRYSAISGPQLRHGIAMWRLSTSTRYDKFDVQRFRPPNRDWTQFGASLSSDRNRHTFD